jgi:hypothetical protein
MDADEFYKEVSFLLGFSKKECCKRVYRFQTDMTVLLEELEYEKNYSLDEIILDVDDLQIIYNMIYSVYNLISEDTLLEKILLYYYIMNIVHVQIYTGTYEDYLGINNVLDTLIPHIHILAPIVMGRKQNHLLHS